MIQSHQHGTIDYRTIGEARQQDAIAVAEIRTRATYEPEVRFLDCLAESHHFLGCLNKGGLTRLVRSSKGERRLETQSRQFTHGVESWELTGSTRSGASESATELADSAAQQSHPRHEPRPRRLRALAITMLVLTIVLGLGAAGTVVYLHFQFADVGEISTPPPEISSDRLGGDERVAIDTEPAQAAVRGAEREESTQRVDSQNQSEPPDDASGGDVVAAWADLQGSDRAPRDAGDTASPDQLATTESGESAPQGQRETGDSIGSAVPVQQASDDSVTILLMGVDARPGDAIDVGVRPDTLAVLHLDGETGSCRLLSLPRDTRTELPGYGPSKINHALAVGGIPYQSLVTQNLLGLEIDHYGLIDFSGVVGLVDAVGGVTVINDAAFTYEGFSFNGGEITLNGDEALTYARYRFDAQGDFGRIGRQQDIVRSLISQTSGMDVVAGAHDLLGAVDGHIKTDFSVTELIGLATDYRSTCTEATLEVEMLSGTVETHPDSLLNTSLSFVIVDPAEVEQKVNWLLGGD